MTSTLNILLPYIFAGIGLIFGSFFNVVIYRLPTKKSIVWPASFCPECKTNIRPYDNIPILSFIILRGKCRHCKSSISIRYPIVEALTGFLFWLSYFMFGLEIQLIPVLLLTSICITITFIDLDHLIIPDVISLPGIPIGILLSLLPGGLGFIESIIGFLAGGVGLYLIALFGNLVFKKESMGGGDIKLAALIGAFLGWKGVLLTIIISSLIGAISGILLLLLSSSFAKKSSHAIPYGPFLALGAIVSMFWGNQLINLYFTYLGI
ncbi:MAG: prepilin peptidase [candidate division Zixibacteria bacterium]|nr:prepilin peptidase [candidate division Zixibacteria bacterium]